MDIEQHVSVILCIVTCNKIRILKFSYEENINQVSIWKNNNNKTLKILKQDQKRSMEPGGRWVPSSRVTDPMY